MNETKIIWWSLHGISILSPSLNQQGVFENVCYYIQILFKKCATSCTCEELRCGTLKYMFTSSIPSAETIISQVHVLTFVFVGTTFFVLIYVTLFKW